MYNKFFLKKSKKHLTKIKKFVILIKTFEKASTIKINKRLKKTKKVIDKRFYICYSIKCA